MALSTGRNTSAPAMGSRYKYPRALVRISTKRT